MFKRMDANEEKIKKARDEFIKNQSVEYLKRLMQPTKKGYTVEDDGHGSEKFVVRGVWQERFAEIMIERGITGLQLNYAKGWQGGSMEFLKELDFLEYFGFTPVGDENISDIHHLHNLKILDFYDRSKTEIDFSNFPNLEQCYLEWRPNAKSLFDCTSLKYLYLNVFKGKDSRVFENLVNLETLKIANGPLPDIKGLKGLKKLRKLALYNLRKLTSLDGLEDLSNLEIVDIDGCRYFDHIEQIKKLKELRVLDLVDCKYIRSIAPLKGTKKLESFLLSGDTIVVDLDFSPLLKLPKLHSVGVPDREIYYPNRDEFFEEWKRCKKPPQTFFCRDVAAEIEFCKNAFGAVETSLQEGESGELIHATIQIYDIMLMFHDEKTPLGFKMPYQDGYSSPGVYLDVEDVDLTIQQAVDNGARITTPAADQWQGVRLGRIIDPSGLIWAIACSISEPSD